MIFRTRLDGVGSPIFLSESLIFFLKSHLLFLDSLDFVEWKRLNEIVIPVLYKQLSTPSMPKVQPNDVAVKMNLLWMFLKPISFSLIGKEVDFGKLDGTIVGYAVLILIVGSLVSLKRELLKIN